MTHLREDYCGEHGETQLIQRALPKSSPEPSSGKPEDEIVITRYTPTEAQRQSGQSLRLSTLQSDIKRKAHGCRGPRNRRLAVNLSHLHQYMNLKTQSSPGRRYPFPWPSRGRAVAAEMARYARYPNSIAGGRFDTSDSQNRRCSRFNDR